MMIRMVLWELKDWLYLSLVNYPREWTKATVVPAAFLGASFVPTIDLSIKLLQLFGLAAALVYSWFQIKKVRLDVQLREKELLEGSATRSDDAESDGRV